MLKPDLRIFVGIATLFLSLYRFFMHVWEKNTHTALQSQQKIGRISAEILHFLGINSSKTRHCPQFLCTLSALFRHSIKNIGIISSLTVKCHQFFAIKPGTEEIFCCKFYIIAGLFYIMAVSAGEKEEIKNALKDGRKISDISDTMGISRDTIRKIKNAEAANPKPDLSNFEKTFEVTGEEVTAEALLKSVGSLAPKILKERLDAGALVLSICGNHAAATGMNLEEYLKTLLLFPAELEQARVEIENLTDLNGQLRDIVGKHIDSVAVTRAIDRVMAQVLEHGTNRINMDVIYAYGEFLQSLRTKDPRLFNSFRMLASQPDSHAIAEANPT
ncbi:MAG: hypothetical protein Q7J35_02380 [Candidatus Methanoperedens sp.]|nr:hypothetical protein [Candidatus Methanoperedens sp.]